LLAKNWGLTRRQRKTSHAETRRRRGNTKRKRELSSFSRRGVFGGEGVDELYVFDADADVVILEYVAGDQGNVLFVDGIGRVVGQRRPTLPMAELVPQDGST
jgi:hypothetical protein